MVTQMLTGIIQWGMKALVNQQQLRNRAFVGWKAISSIDVKTKQTTHLV